jgi:hypothetical protein
MSASRLTVVSESNSASERMQRLKAEARGLADEHLKTLNETLTDVARLAREVCEGGDLYPVGAQELARRLTEDAGRQALTLSAIIARR